MKDLRERTIRGGFAKMVSQAANFLLRVGSLMVLARLLDPRDFGLIGMVTALTGVLNLFRDFGLSTAAVQRAEVTDEQISTLFWINLLVGGILMVITLAAAPFIARFYHEPRLVAITASLSLGFLFNAAGVQHEAILLRHLRFTALSVLGVISLGVSIAVAIGMAHAGFGYWALVGMTLSAPLVYTIGSWAVSGWIPGMPQRQVGVRSMVHFGGKITLNGLVVYIAYNLEKVLLGRFWGADVVGVYGRAYQLSNIPTDNLNSSIGGVAFSALSRLQDEPQRLKSYFLKGYTLVLALTLPITILSALFANDTILVFLGPKWRGAIPIFRLLCPTILAFAMINPFSWLLFAIGRVGRSLRIALVIAPLVIIGYVIGLPYGPKGVALGYSVAMTLWIIPHIAWCVRDTAITFRDVIHTIAQPLVSGIVAAALPLALQFHYGHLLSPLPRLIVASVIFLAVYLAMLLVVMGQKSFYLDLLRGLLGRSSAVKDEALVSV